MKYSVLTRAIFVDRVTVDADSAEEAGVLAHESAEYNYESWHEVDVVELGGD